jgi:hypothetical protein
VGGKGERKRREQEIDKRVRNIHQCKLLVPHTTTSLQSLLPQGHSGECLSGTGRGEERRESRARALLGDTLRERRREGEKVGREEEKGMGLPCEGIIKRQRKATKLSATQDLTQEHKEWGEAISCPLFSLFFPFCHSLINLQGLPMCHLPF